MIKKIFKLISLKIIFVIFLSSSIIIGQTGEDLVDGNLIQFNNNGAWCWYQDERAIIDVDKGKLILGSDASGQGVGGSGRNGDIEGIIYDLQTGLIEKTVFWSPGCDDHNTPAFLIRPDGKYITMYAEHYDRWNSRYRIYDGSGWSAEQHFDWTTIPGGTNYTIAYSNLYYLSDEGIMYNFARANNRCPNFIYSTDLGESWSFGGQLSTNNTNSYNKGYYKYWSNGIDRIDFILTEEHPRDGLTSMYHGYIQDGKTHASDGTIVDDNVFDVNNLPSFLEFTLIFADSTIIDGNAMRKIWNADLIRYNDGTIAAILTSRINNAVNGNDNNINPDHAFIYCRYNGASWSYTYLGQAGKKMYGSEADYTGLGALHPNDPNTIYISTHIDPRDDIDITYREIFKGVTHDNGASWTWSPVTQNSNQHNFRPIIPSWDENNTALLWFRGTYNSAQSFDAAMVGIIERNSDNLNLMTYVDASLSNTTFADGSALVTTGPDPNGGPADNQWHIRTGFGNEGSLFTSAEIGGENAPTLKTEITVSSAGNYDVWVNFWANPLEDWRVKAGFSETDMQLFRQMANKQVQAGDHNTTLILTGSGNTFIYQAYVGRLELLANESFEVFVDDEAIQTGTIGNLIGNSVRTWYDGISYAKVSEVVPVELTSFTAAQNGSSIDLNWNTASELNNRGFEIEKQNTNDNKYGNWVLIGFVKGQGTSTESTEYFYKDNNIDNSVSSVRYRLKQIDYDGTFDYSDAVEVIGITPVSFNLSQNYPNPFNPSTTIEYDIAKEEFITLKIYNVVGEVVETLVNENLTAGNYKIIWNAQNVPSGVYFYRLTAGNFKEFKKMMLLK